MSNNNNNNNNKHPAPEDTKAGAVKKRYRYAAPEDSVTAQALSEHRAATARENSGIPNFYSVSSIFIAEQGMGDFCQERGIVKVHPVCPRCHKKVSAPDKKKRIQRCHSKQCAAAHNGNDWSQSMYKDTFFEDSRGGRAVVMLFLYHWLMGSNYKQLGLITGWSRHKVFSYIKYAQELVATVSASQDDFAQLPIGGEGIIVEIDDESTIFEKRKLRSDMQNNNNNNQQVTEGSWLFGGVENTLKRRYFSVIVPDRTMETLVSIIHKLIAPGSIIRSECWTAQDVIDVQEDSEYICENTTHSLGLVDPLLGGLGTVFHSWYSIKRAAPVRKRGKKQQPTFLFEYIWRRRNEKKLWDGLLEALKEVHYTLSNNNNGNKAKTEKDDTNNNIMEQGDQKIPPTVTMDNGIGQL